MSTLAFSAGMAAPLVYLSSVSMTDTASAKSFAMHLCGSCIAAALSRLAVNRAETVG